jgi:hypothetical protein
VLEGRDRLQQAYAHAFEILDVAHGSTGSQSLCRRFAEALASLQNQNLLVLLDLRVLPSLSKVKCCSKVLNAAGDSSINPRGFQAAPSPRASPGYRTLR